MSFEGFPPDVQREIALKLSPKELIELCVTKKKININICQSEDFWRNKLNKDYPDLYKFKTNETWKNFYLKMVYYISTVEENTGIPYLINEEYSPKYIYDMYKNEGVTFLLYLNALRIASCGGNEEIIRKMLNIYPFPPHYIDDAFYYYILCGNRALYNYFLSIGGTTETSILAASEAGDLEFVEYLKRKL